MPSIDYDDIPPVPVAIIDGYLSRLDGRKMLSASEVRDLLLDVRNALWASPDVDVIERVSMETVVQAVAASAVAPRPPFEH